MSAHTPRRPKSPAVRNKFNDVGVVGRKTGIRVEGAVRVDEDGLENVGEFYQRTSPPERPDARGQQQPAVHTLHKLVSPAPIRKTPVFGSLIGALDMSADGEAIPEDEITTTPTRARPPAAAASHRRLATPVPEDHLDSPAARAEARAASRRATLGPPRAAAAAASAHEWVRSPKRGRRITMAFSSRRHALDAALDDLDHHQPAAPAEDPGELTSATIIEGEEPATPDEPADQPSGGEGDAYAEPVYEEPVYEEPVYEEPADEEAVDEEPADEEAVDEEVGDEEAPVDNEAANDTDEEAAANDIEDPANESDAPAAPQFESPDEMEASDNNQDEEEEEEEEEEAARPPTAKAQQRRGGKSSGRAAKSRSRSPAPQQAVRRSGRTSVQPLAYWRNERIEYAYEVDHGVAVPKVKNIVRVRQTTEEKKHAKRRRVRQVGRQLPSLRGIKVGELDLNDRNRFFYYDDENYGFPVKDDKGSKYGPRYAGAAKRSADQFDDDDDIALDPSPRLVVGPDGASEIQQEVALSRQDIEWTDLDPKGDKYRIGMGLAAGQEDGVSDASSGVLSIAVGGSKPLRGSSNKAVFYLVTSGKVEVRLHSSTFLVGVLGQFLVPQHNSYSITNVGTHPAQLFYVQACMPPAPAAEQASSDDECE
ncbi:mitotic fidelity of chromosome transmission- protein [Coemansia javaensis]|uniref:Mitotic fidelity of chromosome transmission-protein n=1 Tax=Coemansia javaensis TaxID=2761396 RepID=A0A9W8LFP1_9FUNG|nr:mitotic fidelity of chromosome transmission- protein [Coemansia javaensis]